MPVLNDLNYSYISTYLLFQAIKISYLTQGLSLLMLVPRGNSLKGLVGNVTSANLTSITERMQTIRIAATLPLYTLRMTLLLPNKLRDVSTYLHKYLYTT